MRIYTKAGDLAFKTFTFPDGQPHFQLETFDKEFDDVTIELAIRNPTDLFLVLLMSSTLRDCGFTSINLDIRYLLGARMDRSIGNGQPFTLGSVARILNGCGFSQVRILDVHSDVATRLIRNSWNILPCQVVDQVLEALGRPLIVCPDKGAVERVNAIAPGANKIYCEKMRDPLTGALSGFHIKDDFYLRDESETDECLIVDDICDGGGTFVGLAKELRKAGASKVYLYVTHGIFSKGTPLEGIDKIFTTDSYHTPNRFSAVTTIPISMKELPQ